MFYLVDMSTHEKKISLKLPLVQIVRFSTFLSRLSNCNYADKIIYFYLNVKKV